MPHLPYALPRDVPTEMKVHITYVKPYIMIEEGTHQVPSITYTLYFLIYILDLPDTTKYSVLSSNTAFKIWWEENENLPFTWAALI